MTHAEDAKEWQFDGLVGPTHNYAGLSYGNIASATHAGSVANPKSAALEGIAKMRFVSGLGMPQSFLPPLKRPIIPVLQQLGFGAGSSKSALSVTLEAAYRQAPHLLASVFSASSMWAANAATVSPGADTIDGKLHLSPANLTSNFHRSLEAGGTTRLLRTIFHNDELFDVHNALPAASGFADEGAANHMRLCNKHSLRGVELFVYGSVDGLSTMTSKFPARQRREACEAIVRRHGLSAANVIVAQQNPAVIDQGVFHHDVIAMNTTRLMIAHADALVNQKQVITDMQRMLGDDFTYIEVSWKDLPVAEAVKSYFFNAQLLEVPGKGFVILAPMEAEASDNSHQLLRSLVERGVITEVHYLSVRESMRNGGGPACLRLRVVMTERQAQAIHPGVILTDARATQLENWVKDYYRDRVVLDDLRDPDFIFELENVYASLGTLIGMPDLYLA